METNDYINVHSVAVDYKNGKPICMISLDNANVAVKLAEFNLAKKLLTLEENERNSLIEKIIRDFENKKYE